MNLQKCLATYRDERDVLLQRARELAEQDPRICAAWLFGSLGRGDADVLSDIDLFLIVDDAAHADVVSSRYEMMAKLAEPVLIQEAPQNWPPGGVYNMALYAGEFGPHQVDWYWVRRSGAAIPSETVLWFDRAGLPRLDTPTHFSYAAVPEREPAEIASQAVNMFWVMALILAKNVARAPLEDRSEWLGWLRDFFKEAATFAGSSAELPNPSLSSLDAAEVLQILRTWAVGMEQLMPEVVAKGGYIPAGFPAQARRYFDLIESVTAAQQAIVQT
jgi:predicted nucleotidyltransferase